MIIWSFGFHFWFKRYPEHEHDGSFDWEEFVWQYLNVEEEGCDDMDSGSLYDIHNQDLCPLLSSTKLGEDWMSPTRALMSNTVENKLHSIMEELEVFTDELHFYLNRRLAYFWKLSDGISIKILIIKIFPGCWKLSIQWWDSSSQIRTKWKVFFSKFRKKIKFFADTLQKKKTAD